MTSPGRSAALLLLSSLAGAQAQFAGSDGDGFGVQRSIHQKLDGQQLSSAPFSTGTLIGSGDGYSTSGLMYARIGGGTSASPAYAAGQSGGDGYAVAGIKFAPLSGTAVIVALYRSSDTGGDGYDHGLLSTSPLSGTALPLAVYRGNDTGGDGYDVDGLADFAVGGASSMLVLYRGSDEGGDGYHVRGTRYTAITASTAPLAVFTAGETGGDGYDPGGMVHVALNGAAASLEMYVSSDSGGDGYDREGVFFTAINGASAASPAYASGPSGGDGYDIEGVRHTSINAAAYAGLIAFTGGGGDGYDKRGLINVQYLGGGEAASGLTYESWLSSRFSEGEVVDGLASTDADADGDSLPNLMEFVLGADPRVADAAFYGPQFRLSNLADLGLPPLTDRYLTALIRRNSLALDATLTAEVSDTPATFWSTNETTIVDESADALIIRDRVGVSEAPMRLMRFRATLNSAP